MSPLIQMDLSLTVYVAENLSSTAPGNVLLVVPSYSVPSGFPVKVSSGPVSVSPNLPVQQRCRWKLCNHTDKEGTDWYLLSNWRFSHYCSLVQHFPLSKLQVFQHLISTFTHSFIFIYLFTHSHINHSLL